MINKLNTFNHSILYSGFESAVWPPSIVPFSPHQKDIEKITSQKLRDIKSKRAPIDLMVVSSLFYLRNDSALFDASSLLCSHEKSKELLFKMIQAMKINDKNIFYSAVNFEMLGQTYSYLSYLREEIFYLKPKIIFALGGDTFNQILGNNLTIMNARGKFFPHQFTNGSQKHFSKIMAIIHPEILINKPELKALVWDDMKKAMAELKL